MCNHSVCLWTSPLNSQCLVWKEAQVSRPANESLSWNFTPLFSPHQDVCLSDLPSMLHHSSTEYAHAHISYWRQRNAFSHFLPSISFRFYCHTDDIPHMLLITQTKEHTQNIWLDRVWSMLKVLCSWKLLLLGQIDLPPLLPHCLTQHREAICSLFLGFFYPL